jgi:ATP-dependent Clp protease adaptor protein ClpS
VTYSVAQSASTPTETRPRQIQQPAVEEDLTTERPWLVIVWNDPINLMTYVTFVLQKLFGYSKEKATKLMLDVHYRGRAVVATGSHDEAERDTARLHHHGLSATVEQS